VKLEAPAPDAVRDWLERVVSAWEHHWDELTVAAQAVRTDPSVAPAYWSDHRHRTVSDHREDRRMGRVQPDAELRASVLIATVERICQSI